MVKVSAFFFFSIRVRGIHLGCTAACRLIVEKSLRYKHPTKEQTCETHGIRKRWKDFTVSRLHGSLFTFVWPCIVTNFFIIKGTRCTNFTNLFWHATLHVSESSSVHHQEFIHCTLSNSICHTAFRAGPGWNSVPSWSCWKRSTNLYDIYHCWMYSE
jgi:hypothetical protein